jgi:hypothetical protein
MTSFDYDLDEPELRKLILFLLDKIMISGKDVYQYEITAKVDLEQRGHLYLGQVH